MIASDNVHPNETTVIMIELSPSSNFSSMCSLCHAVTLILETLFMKSYKNNIFIPLSVPQMLNPKI